MHDKAVKNLLDRVVEQTRTHAFVPAYRSRATKEECLGIAIAHYCAWSPLLFLVFYAALEEANFPTEAADVLAMLNRLFQKE